MGISNKQTGTGKALGKGNDHAISTDVRANGVPIAQATGARDLGKKGGKK